MRRGFWLPFLAILSVLLHGAALARHHASMLGGSSGSASSHAQLLADLGVICSPGLASKATPDGTPLEQPSTECPVCLGLVAAVVVPAANVNLAIPERGAGLNEWNERRSLELAFETDWPPGTGPPAKS